LYSSNSGGEGSINADDNLPEDNNSLEYTSRISAPEVDAETG
jgi:hypothetical protein